MDMDSKQLIAVGLTGILIMGVLGAIGFSAASLFSQAQVIEVNGLIGSEKEAFFSDPKVIEALAAHDPPFEVIVRKAGSRAMATHSDLGRVDFVFPAGVPAALKIEDTVDVAGSYDLFFTPMVVVSWNPIVEILEANGYVENKGDYYALDMEAYLEATKNEVRWSDLTNNKAYDVNKRILINSTDIRKSNSAAMYLSLASYIENGNNVVQNKNQIKTILPVMSDIFFGQGFMEESSAGPFENLVILGMGQAPMVMAYEAQFMYWMANINGALRPDLIIIYPEPTIFTKHVMLTFSENGQQLGAALETDPTLKRLAVEHGFRNDDLAALQQFKEAHKLQLPDNLVNVIDPPSYEILEEMIVRLEQQ